MLKLKLQLSDIEYKTLANLTGAGGGLKNAAFKLMFGGAEMLMGDGKLNELAVKTINNGSLQLAAKLTSMLCGEGVDVRVLDIRAGLADGNSRRVELDALIMGDVNSVFDMLLPELSKALADNERLSFLSSFLSGNPQAAKAAVRALTENLDIAAQEQLIAAGVNAYYDKLITVISKLLEKNDVHVTINALSAAAADRLDSVTD